MHITRMGFLAIGVAAVTTGVLLSLVLVMIAPYLVRLLILVLPTGNGYIGACCCLFIVLFISILAFFLRQRQPEVYGSLEIVFGLVTASTALTQYAIISSQASQALRQAAQITSDTDKYLFALLGGIYVVVRGLDNIGRYMTSNDIKNTNRGMLWSDIFVPKNKQHQPERVEPRM